MVDPAKPTDDVSDAARAVEDDFPSDDGVLTHDAAFDPGPEASAPAPPPIADLATACVRFVAARYAATLDYTPETLSFVDQWIRDARAELGQRPELVELVESTAGAYLGEVVRRAFGAHWIAAGDYADWRLALSTVYCAFNPIGMVREALLLEDADGWHAHFELDPAEREALEARLAALPEVAHDEFYAPSTRFDVVSIAVDALRASMRASATDDVRFTPDDYR